MRELSSVYAYVSNTFLRSAPLRLVFAARLSKTTTMAEHEGGVVKSTTSDGVASLIRLIFRGLRGQIYFKLPFLHGVVEFEAVYR